MLAALRRHLWKRPVVGALASLAIHLLLVLALVFVKGPSSSVLVKRGEPLFVELPNLDEPAPQGNPAAKTPGPPPTPTPPAPVVKSAPAPKSAPRPTVTAPKPAPEPAPRVASPAPPLAAPSLPKAENATEPSPTKDTARAQRESPPAEATRPQPSAPSGERTAMAPSPREPAPDIRSALRRGSGGGAGGRDAGRGGIEGEPVGLDSKDPKYSDYLDRVRRMIKEKWSYPCVKNPATLECEYKSGQLVIEFGIAKDGHVPFVLVRRSSGFIVMDDYAVNAVKLASPFPAVPDIVSRTGFPILATFNYVVDTSLVNVLR